MRFQVISDSSCDLPKERIQELGVDVVPFYVSFEESNYMREGVDISVEEFYQQMADREGQFPKTSMPSVQDYADVLEKYVKDNVPVLCICLNSAFSGSIQSAMNAKNQLLEDYPEAQIEILDSELATLLQGMLVEEACRLRGAELELKEAVKLLEEVRSTGRIFFTTNDLEYLQHGGRIGKLAGIAAGALKIKPLITLKEGEIFNSGITRSRQKSMQKVVDMTEKYLDEVGAKPGEYSFCIGFGYDYEEACAFREMLKGLVKERLGIDEIGIYQIGATIGVHTGPYPIGIGILKKAEA